MSGGSFNYLCNRDADDIDEALGDLEAMRDRLVALGYDDAARETDELRLIVRLHQVRRKTILDRMRAVWRAVEWFDSGDSGPNVVREALTKYRGEEKPA